MFLNILCFDRKKQYKNKNENVCSHFSGKKVEIALKAKMIKRRIFTVHVNLLESVIYGTIKFSRCASTVS